MIVDASAVLAVVLGEPDLSTYSRAMQRAARLRMSAVNYLEAALRVDRIGDDDLIRALDEAIAAAGIMIVAATPTHAELARLAYRRFGKGNHDARLNLADCFAYALARESGEPLLFKGDDFTKTDVEPAV